MTLTKFNEGVSPITFVFEAVRYTGIIKCRCTCEARCEPQPLEGANAMTKLVLAAVAALSLLASPVLAGPGGSWDDVVQKSGDIQLQGR